MIKCVFDIQAYSIVTQEEIVAYDTNGHDFEMMELKKTCLKSLILYLLSISLMASAQKCLD